MLLIVFAFVTNGARAADWTDANGNKYNALKYLKGNATANNEGGPWLVLTNVAINCSDTIKMKFNLDPAKMASSQALWCSRRNSSTYFMSIYNPTVNGIQFYRKTSSAQKHSEQIAGGTDYTVIADYNTRKFSINGSVEVLSSLPADTFSDLSPLMLFATYKAKETVEYSATPNGNRAAYQFYYLQICSSDGTLRHNLMPATNPTANTVGLYDTVTRSFFTPDYSSYDYKFSTSDWGSDRAGKKWTGLGGDNKMSTAANWANNDKPGAGDDIDFTIAVPFAEIDADINATFGKVYLGAADLPAFSGALTATAINDLTRMQAYDTATDGFAFTLDAPSGQDLTWNGGAAANWWATDVWTYNNAASSWFDNNNAIFNTANAAATLDANASANSLAFSANATIGGAATLTVPSVSVAADVSATISAPTAGALAKIGAGTLTLTENRTDAATTLSEGTLELSGTASLDWTKFTFGTDAAKPVTLEFGEEATLASVPATWYIGNIAGITSTLVKNGGDWSARTAVRVGSAAGTASFYHKGGSLTMGRLIVGDDNTTGHAGTGYAEISGGTVTNTGTSQLPIIGCYSDGTVVVTNSGRFVCNGSLYMGYTESATGILTVVDGGIASIAKDICICSQETATGILNIKSGGTLSSKTVYRIKSGGATVNFDGGTFKKESDNGNIFPAEDDDSAVAVTVSENGGTLDNNALAVALPCTITGEGGMTLSGSGTTTISANQSYLGTTTVSNETTLSVSGGVTFAGPVVFNEDSALDIAGYNGTTPLSATAITFPDEGTVALTFNGGAFPEGVYTVCSASGLTKEVGEKKFSLETEGDIDYSWSFEDDTLVLTVGTVDPNTWTGRAGDGNLSNPANWYGGAVPASGTATINCGAAATLTVGTSFSPDVIVFPETCQNVTISGENAITDLKAITNLSSSICTFEVPIAFADKIDVYQTAYYYCDSLSGNSDEQAGGHVRFAGGVMGTGFAEGTTRSLDGAYTIPATAGWVANNLEENFWTLPGDTEADGSSLTITGSSYETPGTTDTSMLLMGSGCAFTTGVVRTSNRLSYRIYGEYVVTDELEVALTKGTYIAQRYNGTYKFEKLTLSDNGTGYNFYVANSTRKFGTKHLYIGAGGINVNGTAGKTTAIVCGYDDQNSHDVTHLHPWHSDYAINGKGGSTRDLLIYRDTFIHTDDENGVARTVTLNGIADVRAALTIDGSGKLQVNSNGMNGENSRIGGITVTDSATLAYASGADLGAGAVTVGVNATLEIASGANMFEGGLTLDDGATLSFNFTKRTVAPQIAIAEGKTLTANGAVKVKIPEGSLRPTGGEYVLTTCGGFDAEKVTLVDGAPKWVRSLSVVAGNIVLDVKPMGTKVIVR